ncbi:MAG: helix-turn-helix domain-containing protein [Deltaproteobacteria bacterium]|nr:helix-turn-helix domain-containing protein [Deltaproteobacteria bacterium]
MIKYEGKTYLNTEEASQFLGKNTASFRQFYYRSKLPKRKLGGRLYFAQQDLDGLFAKKGFAHFEPSGLGYDDVYTIEQLLNIFMTTKQHVYHLLARSKVRRYKDNVNKTLYNKQDIDLHLNKMSSNKEVDDL